VLFFICSFIFWWDWSLNSGFCTWKAGTLLLEPRSSPLYSGYFGHGVSHTICLGWPQTALFLISASQVARMTGMSRHTWLASSFRSSFTWHVSEMHSWSRVCLYFVPLRDGFPRYMNVPGCLPAHLSMDTWIASTLRQIEIRP
jgi:hypothetical protein